jgi:hypothetical protein
MSLSQVTEDAILNWLLGTPFPPPPREVWLALHSGDQPTLGNEIRGWAGGDRILLNRADFSLPTDVGTIGRERLNAKALMLGVHATAQTVKSFGLWDASTGGTLMLAGGVDPDVVVAAGDPPVFLTGDLSLRAV